MRGTTTTTPPQLQGVDCLHRLWWSKSTFVDTVSPSLFQTANYDVGCGSWNQANSENTPRSPNLLLVFNAHIPEQRGEEEERGKSHETARKKNLNKTPPSPQAKSSRRNRLDGRDCVTILIQDVGFREFPALQRRR